MKKAQGERLYTVNAWISVDDTPCWTDASGRQFFFSDEMKRSRLSWDQVKDVVQHLDGALLSGFVITRGSTVLWDCYAALPTARQLDALKEREDRRDRKRVESEVAGVTW
jgi:hypothetical protein